MTPMNHESFDHQVVWVWFMTLNMCLKLCRFQWQIVIASKMYMPETLCTLYTLSSTKQNKEIHSGTCR